MLRLLDVYYRYSITTKNRFFNQKSNFKVKKSLNFRLLVEKHDVNYVKVKQSSYIGGGFFHGRKNFRRETNRKGL